MVDCIVPIVEGHGEVSAVPVLIRRIAAAVDPTRFVAVGKPIRVPKDRLLKPNELERTLQLAMSKAGRAGGVLILLDCDDDCPAIAAPAILSRASIARPDTLIAVVMAKCEFENWFIAAAESLAGHRDLFADLTAPPSPEDVRGAKEWLSDRMPRGRTYSESRDQAALAGRFNIDVARKADSFDKFFREIERLLRLSD